MRDYMQIPAELLDTIKCWLTVAIQTGIEPFDVSGIETPNRKHLKDLVERIAAYDFHDDEFIEVFRVDFTDGKTCFFGLESVAEACARETGLVTAVHSPRREFYICAAKEVENEYC